MNVHENARTTRHGRRLMVARLASGWSVRAVAVAHGVDPRTVRKWRDRFATEGERGLVDRSSRPHRSPRRLDAAAAAEIVGPRRRRLSSPVIARRLGRPLSTVGRVLRRQGLGRLHALEPRTPVVRCQRERPGELLHLASQETRRITGDRRHQGKTRGRGWEALHVAVDDAARLAYTEMLPDETRISATAFLERALAWFASLGVTVERVMTDNRSSARRSIRSHRDRAQQARGGGSACRSKLFRGVLAARGIRHLRTRPHTPRTNGKAERFIQTSLREWAYATPFSNSIERTEAMPARLGAYNRSRPHAALNGQPPISRLAGDNVIGNDS